MIAKHLAVAVLAASALLGGASAAAAGEVAPPSTLSLVPAKGSLDTPMNVVTSTWCPAGDYFTVAVLGKRLDAEGDNITGATPTEALLPYGDNQMNIPLSSTWKDFAADNAGGRLSGTYTLEVRCRTALDFTPLARFVGKVRITADGYEALGAAALAPDKQKPAPVPAGSEAPAPGPSGSAAPDASVSAKPDPAASQRQTPGPSALPTQEAQAADGQPVTAQAASVAPSGRAAWWPLAVGAGVVLLLLAAWSLWRGRDRQDGTTEWDYEAGTEAATASDDASETELDGSSATTPSV